MCDETRTSADLTSWSARPQQYESLPGQQVLFSEREFGPIDAHDFSPRGFEL
jgi:hypothetical protein